MTERERALACLNYQPYDRLPIVHFGFWGETLIKWRDEGHLTDEEARGWADGNAYDRAIGNKLGFDHNWSAVAGINAGLMPGFEPKVVEQMPDGSRKVLDSNGVVILQRDGAGSIPAEIDHLLKDRTAWEEHYLPRLQYSPQRVPGVSQVEEGRLRGIYCGSLFGQIRNWIGVEGVAYMQVDDPELFTEIIDTVGDLAYRCVSEALSSGYQDHFGHFWEDICFKNGPLINPRVFREKVGPHYKRITDLLHRHGINIVSLDCDGNIDALVPVWLENGVNTMFPIEVGTWNADIRPWREQFGKELRGVGGMNKVAFSRDYAAIDAEIERLKPLVEMGGYIPCPDHRIAPDAKWENVQYYCDKMRKVFGG